MPATLPETFGRYRIVKKLGEGGMGAVYLAEDTRMHRKVALKVPHFDGKEAQPVLERFYREARVAAELRHPSLCPVYDVDCQDGVHYLTMAFIEGTSLADYVRTGQPWPPPHAVALVLHIADALGALHQRGIVHRDLKPANIMIQPNGVPVLLDFGLARSIAAASQQLTAEGSSLGTPAYMAPEQASGETAQIGPRADLYALGILLFQLLTGRLPFTPASMAEHYAQLLHAERPRPSTFVANLNTDLDALCLAMIAIDPAKRPASMAEFAERLQRCATSPAPAPIVGVSVTCAACGKKVKIPEKSSGKRVFCPRCKKPLENSDPLPVLTQTLELPEETQTFVPGASPEATPQPAPTKTARPPGETRRPLPAPRPSATPLSQGRRLLRSRWRFVLVPLLVVGALLLAGFIAFLSMVIYFIIRPVERTGPTYQTYRSYPVK